MIFSHYEFDSYHINSVVCLDIVNSKTCGICQYYSGYEDCLNMFILHLENDSNLLVLSCLQVATQPVCIQREHRKRFSLDI